MRARHDSRDPGDAVEQGPLGAEVVEVKGHVGVGGVADGGDLDVLGTDLYTHTQTLHYT